MFPVVPTVIKGIWDFDSWLDDVYSRCPRSGVDVVMARIRQHG